MIDAGKAYNAANKQFVNGIRELAQQSTRDEVIEVNKIINLTRRLNHKLTSISTTTMWDLCVWAAGFKTFDQTKYFILFQVTRLESNKTLQLQRKSFLIQTRTTQFLLLRNDEAFISSLVAKFVLLFFCIQCFTSCHLQIKSKCNWKKGLLEPHIVYWVQPRSNSFFFVFVFSYDFTCRALPVCLCAFLSLPLPWV